MNEFLVNTISPEKNFLVESCEKIEYSLHFINGVFEISNLTLAEVYQKLGRCLIVIDKKVLQLYRIKISEYFDHHSVEPIFFEIEIDECKKDIKSFMSIIEFLCNLNLSRKETILVVGGGLLLDVAGFACSAYRRSTKYVRIPTTLIGLIDAGIGLKVGINYKRNKNCIGAYYPPSKVFLDFSFLRTLSRTHVRNGMAELIKIGIVASLEIFEWIDEYGEDLLEGNFGYTDGFEHIRLKSEDMNLQAIQIMLKHTSSNFREVDMGSIIAYGHTWSPALELSTSIPLLHGHAVSIDMSLSATIAYKRGFISDCELRRILGLMSKLGLSMNHPLLNIDFVWKATESISLKRDGSQQIPVPNPIGQGYLINDLTYEELGEAISIHHQLCSKYPRAGFGIDSEIDNLLDI